MSMLIAALAALVLLASSPIATGIAAGSAGHSPVVDDVMPPMGL